MFVNKSVDWIKLAFWVSYFSLIGYGTYYLFWVAFT